MQYFSCIINLFLPDTMQQAFKINQIRAIKLEIVRRNSVVPFSAAEASIPQLSLYFSIKTRPKVI